MGAITSHAPVLRARAGVPSFASSGYRVLRLDAGLVMRDLDAAMALFAPHSRR